MELWGVGLMLRSISLSAFACLVIGCACAEAPPLLDGGGDAAREPDGALDDAGADAALPDGDTGIEAPDAGTDAGCSAVPACVEGSVVTCTDGIVTTQEVCDLGCAVDGSARCAVFDASNVDDALFDATADDWRIETSVEIQTDACSIASVQSHVVTQDDGSEACAIVVHDFEVTMTGRLDAHGPRPLIILASGAAHVAGRVDVSSSFFTPGAGGGRGGGFVDHDGAGASAGRIGTIAASAAGGGGGGAFGGGGGSGGAGTGVTGGAGGLMSASVDLIPLRGGSGGAAGEASTDPHLAFGGPGGGALQISALSSIDIEGEIFAAGNGGMGGGGTGGGAGAGGGGGSGGGILLEAPTVDVRGWLGASGGGGGSEGTAAAAGVGGLDGAYAGFRAAGGQALDPLAASGGDGGGLDDTGTLDIEDGVDGSDGAANGAGGGGGVGCIVVRDATGSFVPGATAVVIPSPASSAYHAYGLRLR